MERTSALRLRYNIISTNVPGNNVGLAVDDVEPPSEASANTPEQTGDLAH
jgi:hypothetical protein